MRTQEYRGIRRGLLTVPVLLALLVLLVLPESARADDEEDSSGVWSWYYDADFSGATVITFDDEGSAELDGSKTYFFELQKSALVAINSEAIIYNESQEPLYEYWSRCFESYADHDSFDFEVDPNEEKKVLIGNWVDFGGDQLITGEDNEDNEDDVSVEPGSYVLISMKAGRYYVKNAGSITIAKQWDGEDSFSSIRLTENVPHTFYRNYYQGKLWSSKKQCYEYQDTTQILAPITFSVKKGHVYRISSNNLVMDTTNYSSTAICAIPEKEYIGYQGGSSRGSLLGNLDLNNGYQEYQATETGVTTMYLYFYFQTDAAFDISYSDVTCEVLGHTYGNYTVTKEATVTSKGVKIAACTICGVEKTETIGYKTGVAKASDGKKYYYQSGHINAKKTGVVKSDDKIYKINKGAVDTGFTGTAKYKGTYYYLKKGVSQNALTSMVKVNGKWYYVEKGVISFKKTGVVKYKKELWYVKKSQLYTKKTGIVKYGSDYVYVKNGKCNKKFTGIVTYGNRQVYVKKGYVDFGYLGKVKYKGKTYNIQGGYVV